MNSERAFIEELEDIPDELYQSLILKLKDMISNLELPFHTNSEGGRIVLHIQEILEKKSHVINETLSTLKSLSISYDFIDDPTFESLYSELYIRLLSWGYHYPSSNELEIIDTFREFLPSIETLIASVQRYFSFKAQSSHYTLLSREDRVKYQMNKEYFDNSKNIYWKNHPSIIYGFALWIQLVTDNMNNQLYHSKCIHSILPIMFCLFDDWESQHQILGCKILQLLLPPRIDARIYNERNWIPVIKKTLFFLLSIHYQDSEFTDLLSNIITSLSTNCEKPNNNQDYLETMHLLMNSLLSNNFACCSYYRIEYIVQNHLKGECLVHLKQWISILDRFTLGFEMKSSICSLLITTNILLHWCYPRIFAYTNNLLAFLVKVSITITLDNPEFENTNHEWNNCFDLVKKHSIKKDFDNYIKRIITSVPKLKHLLESR